NMYYDPIKNVFASVIKKMPFFRVLFYKTLDLMFLRSWYVRRELKALRKKFGTGKIDILDAGTGYAQYTHFMSKHLNPCSILSVDVKEEWINDAADFFKQQNINFVNFAVEDLTQINYNNQFDIIICVDVMEHIVDDIKVFSNYFEALKPSGYLLINTPSIYGGSDVHDDHEESFIGEHARDGYSHEDLSSKLVPLGFKIDRYKYTYGFWGDKAWRLGIKYPMQLLNISKIFFILLPVYYLLTFPFTFLMMYFDFISDNKVGSGINFIARKS
ncbi:MAG: class I SAM-dependent methyltransferase, partial [Ignavibacteriaceae bacterium]|nr:class I SAM-dependent methyltransferase [Ignavibacteriaceae bacterium]